MEQIGLEAIMKTESFTSKMAGYVAAVLDGVNANKQAQASMAQMNPAANQAGAALGAMSMKSMALAVALGTALYNAVTKVTGALVDMAKGGVMAAARVQELDVVLQVLGQRSGITKTAIDEQVQSIVDYGIQTDVAMDLVSQFLRYEMDFTKATELARVAQDTAIITMADSSDELQRLMRGIQMGSTEALRFAGIQVKTDEAMKAYADTVGKTTEALTSNERQQALLNAVLKEGGRNAGLYEAAQQTAGKQLRSFTRDMYELTRVMGTPFLTAFSTIVTMMRDLAKTWRTAIDEGGRLHGIMVFLGAVASIVADAFTNLVTKASNGVLNFLTWLADSFEGAANDALNWGANIINQLATGIVQAAASALLWAMNYVSNLLSSWLKGASPPKVAKDIIKWGANTIAMWMKGMTMVDFSALKDLQAPIKSALDALVSEGKMKAGAVGAAFAGISKAITEALKTGNITAALDAIRNKTGSYGVELAKLAKSEFELAAAQKAAKKAQDDLNAAQKAAYLASVKVNDKVNEYNKLLRSGASKDVLAAKLKEVNAAKEAQKAADKDVITAQEKLTSAQDMLTVLQETRDIQKELVGQMLEIMQAQIAAQNAAKAAAAGGAGVAGDIAGALSKGLGKVDLATTMSKAIDDAKAKILGKLNELWASIKQSVADAVGPYLQPLKDAWDKLSVQIQPSLDKLVTIFTPIWEDIKRGWDGAWTWIKAQATDFATTFEQFWRDHGDSIRIIFNDIWTNINNDADIKWAWLKLAAKIFGPILAGIIKTWWELCKEETKVGLDILGFMLDVFAGKTTIDWHKLWDNLLVYMGTITSKFIQIGIDIVQGLIDGLARKMGQLKAKVEEIAASLPDWLKKLLGMTSPSKVFMEIGVNMMKGLAKGIQVGAVIPEKAVRTAAVNVARPVYQRGNTTNNVNMNMGGFNVNNGMDVAMIKTIIRQTVAEAVGGAG